MTNVEDTIINTQRNPFGDTLCIVLIDTRVDQLVHVCESCITRHICLLLFTRYNCNK